MMRQVVRFAPVDGGILAYSVVGHGPPLVYDLGWVSHLDAQWELPGHRELVEGLAERYTVVRYDKFGCGLSDRTRSAWSLAGEVAVLEGLVEHLGLTRYAVLGSCEGGQVAMAHAVARPDAVSALILHGTCLRGEELAPSPVQDAVPQMVRAHWGLGSRVLADLWLPGASPDVVDVFARFQRVAADPETAAELLRMFYRTDVTEVARSVRTPTLVMGRRHGRAVPLELCRDVARHITGAQFVTLEGSAAPLYWEDTEHAVTAITAFLQEHAGGTRRGRGTGLLTGRERQVVDLIAEGATNAQIGRLLGITTRTVDAHVDHVRSKLGVRTRAQIAAWAVRASADPAKAS